MAGTRWTPGRILLLLFLVGTFSFFASLLSMIGNTLASAINTLGSETNATSASAPPELRVLVSMAVTLFALFGAAGFIAILVAADVIRDVLEKG